jgi:HlyD family secretion protein
MAAFLLCLILAGVTACNAFGDGEETTQQVVEVARGDLTVSVSGSGNIETSLDARLSFGSGGRIDRIYVEKGDEVSQGQVLAELDTDALELAKTQAEVALTQAELALTQAQLNQQTAEYNLKNTRDTKDTLELSLLNAQINLRNAEHHLDETRDIYTWPEIEVAQDDVDDWKAFLDYLMLMGAEQESLDYAQARLDAAESTLDAMRKSYDTEEVAIAKLQVEAAVMAEAQAQKNLDELIEDITIMELQLETAKASVEQAQESVALARESLDQAQKQLDEATIIAPIDGVVASLSAEEGDIIPSPTMSPQPVIYLIDPTGLELVVEIDEIDVPEVKLGQEVIIELDALPDTEFKGVVTIIYPLATEVGGVVLYDVKIELDVPEDSGIKVGMSASADIILANQSNVLLVPDRAIIEDSEGRTIVNVMVNEQMEERLVEIGISDGFDTEIINGLREGEMVLIERAK